MLGLLFDMALLNEMCIKSLENDFTLWFSISISRILSKGNDQILRQRFIYRDMWFVWWSIMHNDGAQSKQPITEKLIILIATSNCVSKHIP